MAFLLVTSTTNSIAWRFIYDFKLLRAMTCPNQSKRFLWNLSLIAAIPITFRTASFVMWPKHFMPKHQLSNCVSITPTRVLSLGRIIYNSVINFRIFTLYVGRKCVGCVRHSIANIAIMTLSSEHRLGLLYQFSISSSG